MARRSSRSALSRSRASSRSSLASSAQKSGIASFPFTAASSTARRSSRRPSVRRSDSFPNLLLGKLSLLRTLGRREDRLAVLEAAVKGKEAIPLFWAELANELREDARERDKAERLLRRAIRFTRGEAWHYHSLASL